MSQGGGTLVKTVAKNHRAEHCGLDEDIVPAPGREVRVWMSGRWAVCALICFDAMSEDLIRGLSRVGVNLLLVPAMTARRGSLVRSLVELTNRSQAFCVLACAPAVFSADDDERCGDEDPGEGGQEPAAGAEAQPFDAAFDGPYEETAGALIVPDGEQPEGDGLGIWVFDARDRSATWTQA